MDSIKTYLDVEPPASPQVVVAEIDERRIGEVCQFLASRQEFSYSKDWDFLFNYSWKLAQFPYGYAILEKGEIVAFLGTIFSERVIKGRRVTHCNITTWIVDDSFRSRLGSAGKGLGRWLIDPVLRMNDILITATTPNDRSRKSCERLGFTTLEREQIVIPALPWVSGRAPRESKSVFLTFDPAEMPAHLAEPDRTILADHRSLNCTHFLIKDGKRYCYGIATHTPVKKRLLPALHYLNLCYVSDPDVLVERLGVLRQRACVQFRTTHLRYDARLISGRLSPFERRIPRIRLFRHSSFDPADLDNLYTELVTRNSF